jgi:hypothetical protein
MIRHFYGLVISKFGASFQRFLHNFAAHGFGQVVNVLAQLVLLPAFLHYWTTTEYGEWLVIVSIPSLLWTLDNGLSGLAANRMTVASGMGDWKAANLIFHNVLLIQGTLSLIILTLAGIFVSVVNVHAMFGFSRFEHLTTSHVTEVLMTRQQAGEVLFIMIAQMLMGYGLGLSRAAYRASMLEARGVAITNMERLTYFCSVVLVLTLHGQTVAVAWAMLASTTFWLLFSYTDIRRRCPHITFAFGPLSRVQRPAGDGGNGRQRVLSPRLPADREQHPRAGCGGDAQRHPHGQPLVAATGEHGGQRLRPRVVAHLWQPRLGGLPAAA